MTLSLCIWLGEKSPPGMNTSGDWAAFSGEPLTLRSHLKAEDGVRTSPILLLLGCALSTPPFGRDPIGPPHGMLWHSDGRLQHTSAWLPCGRIFRTRLHRHRRYQHRQHKADTQTANSPIAR